MNKKLDRAYYDILELRKDADAKEIKKAFKKAEDKVSKELGIEFVLTPKELNRLKMADMLELVMYCHKLNDSNSRMKLIMHTGVTYLMDNYSQLPDFDPVSQILKKLKLII